MDHELLWNREACQQALACWFLVGATASGKTVVSLELAKRLNAEIISLDSMSIYRHMDIGTAKPTREQQSLIPHHLIDIIDPNETYSVSRYRNAALESIKEIRSRGKEVLFVGGSALYLKTLLRGMFEGPTADWKFRESVELEADQAGDQALHDRLRSFDPISAHKLHVNDRRRIVRALEVLHLTGQPISHWQMQFDHAHQANECRVFVLRHARPVLHERIEQRVQRMYFDGLVEELQTLLASYGHLSRTASQAVGYCEVIEFLSGKRSLPEAQEQTLIRTRRFARHQETWFRGLSESEFVEVLGETDPEVLAENILERGRTRPSTRLFENPKT